MMGSIRKTVSGGSTAAAQRQLADELSVNSKEERGNILKQAGIVPEVPAEEGLAMKAELGLPWNKLRYIRR